MQAPFLSTNLVGFSGASCFFSRAVCSGREKKDASCVNGADWEGCDFPFSFLLFSLLFCSSKIFFLLQGQPGQEDGGGVNEDPGFRSVCQKKHCWLIFFCRSCCQDHFKILFCQSCQKTIFTTSQPCCLQVPPQRRGSCHRGRVGRQNPRGSTRARIGLDLAAYWDGGSSWG